MDRSPGHPRPPKAKMTQHWEFYLAVVLLGGPLRQGHGHTWPPFLVHVCQGPTAQTPVRSSVRDTPPPTPRPEWCGLSDSAALAKAGRADDSIQVPAIRLQIGGGPKNSSGPWAHPRGVAGPGPCAHFPTQASLQVTNDLLPLLPPLCWGLPGICGLPVSAPSDIAR